MISYIILILIIIFTINNVENDGLKAHLYTFLVTVIIAFIMTYGETDVSDRLRVSLAVTFGFSQALTVIFCDFYDMYD